MDNELQQYIKKIDYYECTDCHYKISALAFFNARFAFNCPNRKCYKAIDSFRPVKYNDQSNS